MVADFLHTIIVGETKTLCLTEKKTDSVPRSGKEYWCCSCL